MRRPGTAAASVVRRTNGLRSAWTVFSKELVDALRDRRTLLAVILSSVAVGPLLLTLLSTLASNTEKRAEAREILVDGIERAPTLKNFLERQTLTIKTPPADYEAQLRDKRLSDPVLVVPADFEHALHAGEAPRLVIVGNSTSSNVESGSSRAMRALQAFGSEQAVLRLAVRGVSPALVQPVQIDERDLANPGSRAAQLTGMLPFFVLMAVLYGAMNAALDTTAGERERGSLEPLLMNPAPKVAIVVGKWGAVASVGVMISVLSCLSFLPGQWLLKSETLAALFQFGIGEAVLFVALLLPVAAALSAAMMALAIRCKTFKEAQANNAMLLFVVSMLPLVTIVNQGGDEPWHLWVPALAQTVLMGRVLKGEAIGALDLALPVAVCAAVTVACLAFVVKRLTTAAVK